MKAIHIATIAAICSCTMIVGGCLLVAAGAAGAGTVAYVRGELEVTLNATMDASYNAVLKALSELELATIEKQKDALGAKVVARNSADKKITIILKSTGDKLTSLTIRIGVFGDQPLSQTIYDHIKKNL